VQAYAQRVEQVIEAGFGESLGRSLELLLWLAGPETADLSHAELETQLVVRGREVLRQAQQDHLDSRQAAEVRLPEVVDADGVARVRAEPDRSRGLATVLGQVRVGRLAYRGRGCADLHPADARLNLPVEKYSHGLRRLTAEHAAAGSFASAAGVIAKVTGVGLGNRQVEQLACAAVVDFEDFYQQRVHAPAGAATLLVMQFDGKGIKMRPGSLRRQTAAKAAKASTKLRSRLSKGEKRHRKRMAEVGAVYDAVPWPRTVADVMPTTEQQRARARPRPKAVNKWLTASVTDDTDQVIAAGFAEAARRDPGHERTWVALVDGNAHQIACIRAQAASVGKEVTIVVDFIHVLEYLWKAAWCFYPEGDPAAEAWVHEQATKLLTSGQAGQVAAAVRRKATHHGLEPADRKGADEAATYLHNHRQRMDYPTALASGWPIATGVIEGACRHLVKDRMDITGARWCLQTAEAVLKLRALITNGDLEEYWTYHLNQEHDRVHKVRYAHGLAPDTS
jgi:hypothetical protein